MIDSYDKLTVGKFMEISEVLNAGMDEVDSNSMVIAILSDMDVDDVLNLPLGAYNHLLQKTGFLMEQPKTRIIADRYRLGGMDLDVMLNLKNMTAGQYIDYQHFIKDPEKYMVELLSVFLIPRGKKYGDGYEIMDVHKVIREHLSIVDAVSMSAFFLTLSRTLIKVTLTSLTKDLKKMRKKTKNQEEIRKLEQAIANLENVGDGLHLLTE
jgi:hypothetical protein